MRHGVDKECVLAGVPELDQRCDDTSASNCVMLYTASYGKSECVRAIGGWPLRSPRQDSASRRVKSRGSCNGGV